ncbi:MAG: hypothetical protein ACXWPM_10460 [Bdellovibrionota bacterium]
MRGTGIAQRDAIEKGSCMQNAWKSAVVFGLLASIGAAPSFADYDQTGRYIPQGRFAPIGTPAGAPAGSSYGSLTTDYGNVAVIQNAVRDSNGNIYPLNGPSGSRIRQAVAGKQCFKYQIDDKVPSSQLLASQRLLKDLAKHDQCKSPHKCGLVGAEGRYEFRLDRSNKNATWKGTFLTPSGSPKDMDLFSLFNYGACGEKPLACEVSQSGSRISLKIDRAELHFNSKSEDSSRLPSILNLLAERGICSFSPKPMNCSVQVRKTGSSDRRFSWRIGKITFSNSHSYTGIFNELEELSRSKVCFSATYQSPVVKEFLEQKFHDEMARGERSAIFRGIGVVGTNPDFVISPYSEKDLLVRIREELGPKEFLPGDYSNSDPYDPNRFKSMFGD